LKVLANGQRTLSPIQRDTAQGLQPGGGCVVVAQLSIAVRGSHPAVSQPECNHASTLDEGDGWAKWSELATLLTTLGHAVSLNRLRPLIG
jgi:hypothetical protein